MWNRSAQLTFPRSCGRDGTASPFRVSWLRHLHGPALVLMAYSKDCSFSVAKRMSASIQQRFHCSEQLGSKGRSRRLASSPVPKNGKDDSADENASSNFPSSRFASFHPACQLRVAPRLNASSRKRAPQPASYCSATWAGTAAVSFSGSDMEITFPAVEQTDTVLPILLRFLFALYRRT